MKMTPSPPFILTKRPAANALLLGVSILLLCQNLAARQLWTQEGRWGLIVWQMITDHNYWQPTLAGQAYYDKPLLSYWLMLAVSKVIGFNNWALRLPAAAAGLLTLFSTYRIARLLDKPATGLLAAWLLLTTFYFVFWARVASADMLNVAGIMFALSCYFNYRDTPRFKYYVLFFTIIALACLCKGLVAVVCVGLAVLPAMMTHGFRQHINGKMVLAAIVGGGIYFFPFVGSHLWGQAHYSESGLMLVFRENILRYFQPFDHTGHWYSYFFYLPLYTLPWTPVFLWSLYRYLKGENKTTAANWALQTLFLLFVFFSFSGSRRSYYVLPMVPVAVLFTALTLSLENIKSLITPLLGVVIVLLLYFTVILPWPSYNNSLPRFAEQVRHQASAIKPWQAWTIISVKALPRTLYYLRSSKPIRPLKPADVIHALPQTEQAIIVTRWQYYKQWPSDFSARFTLVKQHIDRSKIFHQHADLNDLSVALIPTHKKN